MTLIHFIVLQFSYNSGRHKAVQTMHSRKTYVPPEQSKQQRGCDLRTEIYTHIFVIPLLYYTRVRSHPQALGERDANLRHALNTKLFFATIRYDLRKRILIFLLVYRHRVTESSRTPRCIEVVTKSTERRRHEILSGLTVLLPAHRPFSS